jgi:diphthine synthase
MTLAFVGLGLEQSPTLYTIEILKKCDRIFYENYTSPVVNPDLKSILSDSVDPGNKKIEEVGREFVEDGRKILDYAKNEKVAIVSSGDPMIATTHQELRTRAIKSGIDTRIVHGSSIFSAVSGELGLSSYSFGKTVTITRTPMQYTAYDAIYQNLLRGLHTTVLLEWDQSSNFFLSPKDALSRLVEAEKDLKYGIITNETILLSVSELGRGDDDDESKKPKISLCTFSDYSTQDFGAAPITLVVPGKLHFTEVDALSAITGRPESFFLQNDNSNKIEKIAKLMLEKYSQKTLNALTRARSEARKKGEGNKKYDSVFENVELYTSDAVRFLNEGKEELAILSIGYAEGLLDSLRFSGELDFEW